MKNRESDYARGGILEWVCEIIFNLLVGLSSVGFVIDIVGYHDVFSCTMSKLVIKI